jgi:hyperosmotically inducible periplasmic protein
MRAPCLVLLAVGLVAVGLAGCGRIDSSRSNPNVDASAPAVSRSGETDRGPAVPTNDATTPAPTADHRAAEVAVGEPRATPAPDNTAVNTRDANRTEREPKLPIDQKENQADIDLTAKIRQAVLKIDGLSVNGRNCKIVTSDGQVTLRGPVNSATEREQIVKAARDIAGENHVDDQLEIAPLDR